MTEEVIPAPIFSLIKDDALGDPCDECRESYTYPGEWDLCEYHMGMIDGWALRNVSLRPTGYIKPTEAPPASNQRPTS